MVLIVDLREKMFFYIFPLHQKMKTPYIMLTKSSLHIVIEILRLPQTYLIVSDSDGHIIRM